MTQISTVIRTAILLCFLYSSLPPHVLGVTWENFFVKEFFNATFSSRSDSSMYTYCINTIATESPGINMTVTDEFFIYYSNRTNRIFTDSQFEIVPCGFFDGAGEVANSFTNLRDSLLTDMNWTQVCLDSYNLKISINFSVFDLLTYETFPCPRPPTWHSALASPNNTHMAWCILTYNTGSAWLQWMFRDQIPITNITSTPPVDVATLPPTKVPGEIVLPPALALSSTIANALSRIILFDFTDPFNNVTFNNVYINTTDSAGQVKTMSDLLYAIPSTWWQPLCGLLSEPTYVGAGVYSNIIPDDNRTFYVNCSNPASRLNLSDILPTTTPAPTSPETTIESTVETTTDLETTTQTTPITTTVPETTTVTTPMTTTVPEKTVGNASSLDTALPNVTAPTPHTEIRVTTKSSSEKEYLRVIATNQAYVKKRQEEITSGYGILLVALVLGLLVCVCTYGLLRTVVPRV